MRIGERGWFRTLESTSFFENLSVIAFAYSIIHSTFVGATLLSYIGTVETAPDLPPCVGHSKLGMSRSLIIAFLKARPQFWVGHLCLLLFFGCQTPPESIERPQDPWVIRSVLDKQVRMVTLALDKEAYAAYNTENCALYKLWNGGVHWDGAVYNNVKTIQPISWGNAYWEKPVDDRPWKIERNGQLEVVDPEFKGYRLEDNQITFQYDLPLTNGTRVKIFENPEFVPEEKGKVGFRRTFRTEGMQNDLIVWNGELRMPSNVEQSFTQYYDVLPTAASPSKRYVSGAWSQYWLDRSGCNTCHELDEHTIGPGYRQIADKYENDKTSIQYLIDKVKQGGAGVWGSVPMQAHPELPKKDVKRMIRYILSLRTEKKVFLPEVKIKAEDEVAESPQKPGFGSALEGLHPSLMVQTIHPNWLRPRVGGMDFLPDGRLLISTWDSLGAIYALSGVETGDTNHIRIERIAAGLSEPLGIKVVEDDIFVLQKRELTQLIDHDQDGITDEYRNICNAWGATADFHEFSFGLEYKDGFFYAGLGLAFRLMSHELQHPDRGTVIKIGQDGGFQKIITGLRQPNGLGVGPDNELFITENQGRWVPACKVIHVREGHFHGCQYGAGDRYEGLETALPAVWLPQDEIGNSPGQPVLIPRGIYAGQLLHGEVTHGGLKRVFLEKINDSYQGAVFRFTQGLEAGINRSVWGPDGALYVGGIGMHGNWGWKGQQYGLQRLEFTDRSTFEILKIEAVSDGFDLTFTEGLAEGQGEKPAVYTVQQWWYKPTPKYGGPKMDLETLSITEITLSSDRKRAHLAIPGLKDRRVVYFLLSEELRSVTGQSLWTGEAWYTLNSAP